jgi:transglutaminase-like putative cysteine protease/Flp pilus assembly protein TadD
MKTMLRHLLLVSLLAFCCYLSAQTRNPYDLKVGQLYERVSSLDKADELEKLILLDRMFRLRDQLDDRGHLESLLSSLAEDPRQPQLVRHEASVLSGSSPAVAERWFSNDVTRRQVLSEAASLVRADDASSYQWLAELEFLAASPDAASHMERAAQLRPTAERWQRLASFTDDPFRKFAALQSGLALAPTDSQLNLQLGDYYIGRNQLEKARDVLIRASSAAPDDFVIRERLAALYLNLGLRSHGLHELQQLQERFPHPGWLRSRLALDYEHLGLRNDAAGLAASVLDEESNSVEMLELLARFHTSRQMTAKLKVDYLALCRLQPQSVEVWRRLALLEFNSGDLNGARSTLWHLLQLSPADADGHRLLAQAYQRLHLDAQAQQELSTVQRDSAAGEATASAQPDEDRTFLENASALVKEAFLHPPKPADVALADICIQQLEANGLDRVHVQQIFFIGSDAALDAHRVTELRYSPSSETLRVVRARDWKPDGKSLDAQDLGDREGSDASLFTYYDARTRELRFTGLEKGDVIEVEYSISPALHSSPYGRYFGELVFFAGPAETQLKRYVLIAPATETIYSHAEKVEPPTALVRDEKKIFVWEAHQVPALLREPRGPGMTELSPYVHVSTFSDWQQLGAWYADLVRPQFALDQALQEKLLALLQGKHSDRERIAAIQDFVLRGTHYVAQEFGIYSYQPYPVAQTYARRFGDCKDKASLMIALLRASGIDARLALLRTRSLGSIAAMPASIAVFNHAIVYIPKYDLWLDGTADYAVRELPLDDQGAMALTVDLDGTAQLRYTPMSRAADNYTRHIIQAQLTNQGTIRFSGSTAARGEDAPGLRQELSVREQQLDSWRRDLAQVFPTVQVYSVTVRDEKWAAEEQADDGINVDFRGDLSFVRQKRVVSLSSTWMPRSYAAALAPSSTRSQDLVLFAPWTTEEEIHVALPAGARVAELPHEKSITTSFGSLRLHYRKLPGSILVQSKMEFDKARIAAADYPAFRDFCLTAERSFRDEIKVELPQ